MFIAVLFTIARTWKQHKCPSAEEWMKMWCINIVDYYSDIEKNEIMPFAETWMDLEIIILSKVSQKEKDKYHSSVQSLCHVRLFVTPWTAACPSPTPGAYSNSCPSSW